MLRSIVALFVAIVAFPINQLMATVIPPSGLVPGSQYQLAFVTNGRTFPDSADINIYNTFVTNEADDSPSLPSAAWHAVVSTINGINANANAPSLGLPVYNTAGQEVASAATGLYSGTLLNPIAYDQYGNSVLGGSFLHVFAWTGSNLDGTEFQTLGLGAPFPPGVAAGLIGDLTDWLLIGVGSGSTLEPLYALSGPITVPTPEPATLTLLGSALLVIGGVRLLQWRRRAT